MKFLVSAYACEPGKGSEQEVGWQRVLDMVRYADEVWVLTRSNNREIIELDPRSRHPHLHFIYYDLPSWLRTVKKSHSAFLYLYLYLWQRGAFRLASAEHARSPFDAVFHVTFTNIMTGSRMGELRIPFFVGPIAGGERTPAHLLRTLPIRHRMFEYLRNAGIQLQRFNPITRSAFRSAHAIFATSKDSVSLIPKSQRGKAHVQLGIGLSAEDLAVPLSVRPPQPRFVCIARLLHWKGIHLAIKALARVQPALPEARLVILGTGPEKTWLSSIAHRSGVADRVIFLGHVERKASAEYLKECTALVFPSFHDSGGMAVLESLARGTPVICLDLGGPDVIVDSLCGRKVETSGKDEQAIISDIARAMLDFARMPLSEFQQCATAATMRARLFTWGEAERSDSARFHNHSWQAAYLANPRLGPRGS